MTGTGYETQAVHDLTGKTGGVMKDFGTPIGKVLIRRAKRELRMVDAVVLHQTGFNRGNSSDDYLKTNAHFVVLPDGKLLQLHPVDVELWASNAFNDVGIAIEFVGNFPNSQGSYWIDPEEKIQTRSTVTPRQITGGRELVTQLKKTYALDFVFAHRQGYVSNARMAGLDRYRSELRQGSVASKQTNQRSNCPGPDIWFNVGEWAISNLGLSDGGKGYVLADGDPIPSPWRVARS